MTWITPLTPLLSATQSLATSSVRGPTIESRYEITVLYWLFAVGDRGGGLATVLSVAAARCKTSQSKVPSIDLVLILVSLAPLLTEIILLVRQNADP
jgi:hypothetical protein